MTEKDHLTKAVAIAPLVAPVLYIAGGFIVNPVAEWSQKDLFGLLAMALPMAAAVSYIATILLGIPYYLLLRKIGRLSFVYLVGGGFLLGALSLSIFWIAIWGPSLVGALSKVEILRLLVIGAVLGGAVAACFALISGITMRPSRRSKLRGLA